MTISRLGILTGWLALGLAVPGWAQDAPPVVVTHGTGVVRVVPDRAFVTLTRESRASSPNEAQRLNAEGMTAINRVLDDAELAPDAIRTLGVNLQPEYDFQDGRRTLRGYVAVNIISVRVDDLARLGEIMDSAVGSGATAVSGVQFDVGNRSELERRALGEAVADARARAEAAALGAGQAIDGVVRIEESGGVSGIQPTLRMAMQAEGAAAITPIAPGQIEIRASVTLTARLR